MDGGGRNGQICRIVCVRQYTEAHIVATALLRHKSVVDGANANNAVRRSAAAQSLIRVLTMSFHCGTIQSGVGSCPGRRDCPAHNGATKTTTRGGITGAVIIAPSARHPSLKPPSKDDVGLRIEFRRCQTLAPALCSHLNCGRGFMILRF